MGEEKGEQGEWKMTDREPGKRKGSGRRRREGGNVKGKSGIGKGKEERRKGDGGGKGKGGKEGRSPPYSCPRPIAASLALLIFTVQRTVYCLPRSTRPLDVAGLIASRCFTTNINATTFAPPRPDVVDIFTVLISRECHSKTRVFPALAIGFHEPRETAITHTRLENEMHGVK